jgi:hypothetical protein
LVVVLAGVAGLPIRVVLVALPPPDDWPAPRVVVTPGATGPVGCAGEVDAIVTGVGRVVGGGEVGMPIAATDSYGGGVPALQCQPSTSPSYTLVAPAPTGDDVNVDVPLGAR